MTQRLRHLLVALTLCACSSSLLSGISFAQSDEVVELFERGLEAYRLANYEDAERLFAEAHALEPLPDLSYNHARALELLGRFGDAADVYARFLREAPDTDDRDVIEARIRNLRARQEREEEPVSTVEVSDPVAVELPNDPPESARSGEGPSLVGPMLVVAGGLALGGAGLGTGLAARSAHDTALAQDTSQIDADAANTRADRLALATTALFIAGGAVVAAGVTWLVVRLVTSNTEEDPTLSLQPAPGGALIRGTF